jgi:hypothetical protein
MGSMASFPIPTNPQPIEQVPLRRPQPTFRDRAAAAYERSAWARLAFMGVMLAFTFAGLPLACMLPGWIGGPLAVLWMLAVSLAGACYIIGPYRD